jgi:hypothetical protein
MTEPGESTRTAQHERRKAVGAALGSQPQDAPIRPRASTVGNQWIDVVTPCRSDHRVVLFGLERARRIHDGLGNAQRGFEQLTLQLCERLQVWFA